MVPQLILRKRRKYLLTLPCKLQMGATANGRNYTPICLANVADKCDTTTGFRLNVHGTKLVPAGERAGITI